MGPQGHENIIQALNEAELNVHPTNAHFNDTVYVHPTIEDAEEAVPFVDVSYGESLDFTQVMNALREHVVMDLKGHSGPAPSPKNHTEARLFPYKISQRTVRFFDINYPHSL